MEDAYLTLISYAGMIYDCYQDLANGNKKAFGALAFLVFSESLLYNRFLNEPEEITDDIIDNFGNEDENSAITFAFDDYSKDKFVAKRICDRLNNISKIAKMKLGAALIPADADYSNPVDFEDCKIFFLEYLKILNDGIAHINLAYHLAKDNYKKEAYKLAFTDDFVEKSLLFYHGEFRPYDPDMRTLLDELRVIACEAVERSNADVAEIIMDYMDIYYDSKDENMHKQLIDMILSLPDDEVKDLMDVYKGMLDCNQIENGRFQEYQRLIMSASKKE